MTANMKPSAEIGSPKVTSLPSFLSSKLWLYTNFDCNLECTYCVAESTPKAPRLGLGLENVRRLVDEASELGFRKIYFTGGEPFILPEIYDMLAYTSAGMKTTVLTNAMLLSGKRLERLTEIANENLTIQVSLDGGSPGPHDAKRGEESWKKTVAGIRALQANGFHILISTTQTSSNAAHMAELGAFLRNLGISDEDHLVRPLARRGFSREGIEVGIDTLIPEVTIASCGVYWHPLISPDDRDMLVTTQIFPLENAIRCIEQLFYAGDKQTNIERTEFT